MTPSLQDPNVLSLLYAAAGLAGGALNAKVSGKALFGNDGIAALVTGAVLGGVWYLWPIIDFKETTPVVSRMFVILAISFFASDTIRNQILNRFGIKVGPDK